MGLPKTSDHIKINIKMPNFSQEPPVSSKAPNQDLMDMDVLCTFKIKIENKNLEQVCPKDQWQYLNQYQDAKPQSGTCSLLQSPKSGLKGCSLHLQNQNREQTFGSWVYQKQVTISKSKSRCQCPVRNFQHPQSPKPGLQGKWFSWHHQNQDRELKLRTQVY